MVPEDTLNHGYTNTSPLCATCRRFSLIGARKLRRQVSRYVAVLESTLLRCCQGMAVIWSSIF